jgi:hypothetical protein
VAALSSAQEIKAGKINSKIRIRFATICLCVLYFSTLLIDFNKNNCAGVYDEMRVLEVEDPSEPVRSNLTAAEEEALLYGSDKEGEPGDARGTSEPGESGNADCGGIDEEEKERRKAEREAEEADLLAKQAELSERIRRRKAEREKKT